MKLPKSSSGKLRYKKEIVHLLTDSIRTKVKVLEQLVPVINEAAEFLVKTLSGGNKILIFGNGGSAADSQHMAAELIGKLSVKRRALPAIALTTDTSNLTALANDFGYDVVFQRQIEALGQKGDVAIGISTSGHSPSVLAGIKSARKKGLKTIAFSGRDGGPLSQMADIAIVIPSTSTQRIQESHITVAHILCEIIEAHFS